MVNFAFTLRTAIEFGPGVVDRIGAFAAEHGRRAFLVTGARALERSGVLARVHDRLASHHVTAVHHTVDGEPDTDLVDRLAAAARASACDLVIAIGGGSALDTGKAVAGLATQPGTALDHLEVVGRGQPLTRAPLPMVAVPTTAGTGSEVTHNAVLADAATGTKASLRDPSLAPRRALLDPLLTHTAPPDVTARTGLDALIQLIEPYVSKRAQPLVDVLALDGIRRAAVSLPRAYHAPDNAAAREDMMLVALLSGVALAHCGLGAAHAFAGPLGGSYPIPHGVACAAVIPHVMAANVDAAHAADDRTTVRRHAEVARALGIGPHGDDLADARAGVAAITSLCRALDIPGLAAYGVTRDAFDDLIARARRTSSMRANPVDLDDRRMTEILDRSLGPARPVHASP